MFLFFGFFFILLSPNPSKLATHVQSLKKEKLKKQAVVHSNSSKTKKTWK